MNAVTPTLSLTIAPERADQARAVDALINRAFGPGRYAKVSERLREGNRQRMDLSFVAAAGEEVIGAVRLWPVMVGETRGLYLGPIAVDPAWRKHGVAAGLVGHAVQAGAEAGERFVLLVGDLFLFGPQGFEAVPRGTVTLPGSADPGRILWRALGPQGLDGVCGRAHVPLDD